MKGRKPKPTRLKELTGNPGRRPLNDREPKPTAARPSCPSWLSKEAKAEWRRIVPELERLGLLTLVDRTALAAYCQAAAELEIATKQLNKEGRIIFVEVFNKAGEVSGSVQKPHPAIKLQRDAFRQVKAYLAEFGLTPSARTRVKTPEKTDESDPLMDLLNGKGLDN